MPLKTRYIIEYVPRMVVGSLCEKHHAEIEAGASVWDFVQPEDIAQEREQSTIEGAWEHARILVPSDEFGEVHVFEQHPDKFGCRNSWETFRRAVVTAEDTQFEWQDCHPYD